ncbi:MAG: hypothetical protein ACKO8U_13870, partial [Pirellula sp.]
SQLRGLFALVASVRFISYDKESIPSTPLPDWVYPLDVLSPVNLPRPFFELTQLINEHIEFTVDNV